MDTSRGNRTVDDGDPRTARISVLGPVGLAVPGSRTDVLPAQGRKILALLAVNAGFPLSAQQIVRRLWDEPPGSAVQMVRNQIRAVRSCLAASCAGVHSDRAGYRLAGHVEVDAVRFR